MAIEKKEMDSRFTLKEKSNFEKAEKEIDNIIILKYVTGNKIVFFFEIDTSDQLKEEIANRYAKAGWTVKATPFYITFS